MIKKESILINLYKKISIIFLPIAVFVRLVYRIRRYLYLMGFFKSFEFSPRVISVGNLTLGGSGKTPLIKWILRNIDINGEVLISSRGYRSKAEKSGVIQHADQPSLGVEEIGDENEELLLNLTGGTISVGRDRVRNILLALKERSFKLLILDDGFQHLKIKRNLDIILFNTLIDPKLLRVFPSGYLREGMASLFEADCIIYTNCNSGKISAREEEIRKKITPYCNSYVHEFRTKSKIQSIFNIKTKEKVNNYNEREYILVSGISGPEKFSRLAKENGIKVIEHLVFSDHHQYSKRDILKITSVSQKHKRPVLLTRKDASKFVKQEFPFDIFCCDISLSFFGDEQKFKNVILGDDK